MGHQWRQGCAERRRGGTLGHEKFLETLRNEPDSQDARELLDWVGGPFDPEAFDRRMANAALLRMAWNG